MDIINLFWSFFPWSLIPVGIPVFIFFIFFWGNKTIDVIKDRVEVFFRGGTKAYYDCVVNNDMVTFKVNEQEFQEPILTNPRIEYDEKKKQIYRSYMYAEGLSGTIEVPPLTRKMKQKMIEILVENKLFEIKGVTVKESDKDNKDNKDSKDNREKVILTDKQIDSVKDDDLFRIIRYYNFDIENIAETPIMKNYNSSLIQFSNTVSALLDYAKKEAEGGTMFFKFLLILLGALLGFFIGYSLTLKGVI